MGESKRRLLHPIRGSLATVSRLYQISGDIDQKQHSFHVAGSFKSTAMTIVSAVNFLLCDDRRLRSAEPELSGRPPAPDPSIETTIGAECEDAVSGERNDGDDGPAERPASPASGNEVAERFPGEEGEGYDNAVSR
jgi:hypothetical protein